MILRYFAAHSDQRSGRRDAEQLFEVVKYAIDLVEAFGNATTKQNSNSSRFGRVFKVSSAILLGVQKDLSVLIPVDQI